MNKRIKKIFAVFAAIAIMVTCFGTVACSSGSDGTGITVNYNLNYDNMQRTITVRQGTILADWKPYREGYEVEGWYTDAQCTKPYDFNGGVKSDITLYAKWQVAPEYFEVIFDYNYVGSKYPVKISVKENDKISEEKCPKISRIGTVFDGWFTDEACTNKWDFDNDTVTAATTLYAKYSYDGSVKRDEHGQPIFGETTTDESGNEITKPTVVHFTEGVTWGPGTKLPELINEFNEEFSGKINVVYERWDGNQTTHAIRFQQTHDTHNGDENYYSIADMYNLAGLDFDYGYWYDGMSRDSKVKGELKTIPFATNAPYIVYNKSLLADNELPTNYSELSALIKKIYDEQSASKPDFNGLITNDGWIFTKATAEIAFMQNDSVTYKYDPATDHYINDWDKDETHWANATAAITNLYNLLGVNGKDHGNIIGGAIGNDSNIVDKVASGTAFMGIINSPDDSEKRATNDKIGILPLSGLFTDGENANKNAIPVTTVGFHFYNKATSVSNTQLAAATVFADWIGKKSARVGETGWYPCRKEAVESTEFTQSENQVVNLLKKVGNPEDFLTLDGNPVAGWALIGPTYTNYIKPILESNGENLPAQLKRMRNLMGERLY